MGDTGIRPTLTIGGGRAGTIFRVLGGKDSGLAVYDYRQLLEATYLNNPLLSLLYGPQLQRVHTSKTRKSSEIPTQRSYQRKQAKGQELVGIINSRRREERRRRIHWRSIRRKDLMMGRVRLGG